MRDARPENPAPTESLLAQAGWVRALARRLVSRDEEADDAVQATWLAALEKPPALRTSPKSWLRAVLSHVVSRSSRRSRLREEGEAAADPRRFHEPASDVVQRGEVHQKLVAAVMSLEEPGRSTVLMHYFDGLPLAEIARRLGAPAGTIRARHHRALEDLRARLGASGLDWRAMLLPLARIDAMLAGAGKAATEVLAMTAKAKVGVAVAGVVLVAAAVLFFPLRGLLETRAKRGPDTAGASSGEGDLSGLPGAEPVGPRPPQVAAPKPFQEDDRLVLAGHVRGEDGAGVAGARVIVVRYDFGQIVEADAAADTPGGFPRVVATDAHGRFRLETVASAPAYAVLADAPDRAPKTVVAWAARLEPLEIVLESGVVLEGCVREIDRTPVSGARAAFHWFDGGIAMHREARTDARGLYRIGGVARALEVMRYMLEVSADGFASQKFTWFDRDEGASVIHQDVFMTRGATLSGKVTEAENGAPIAGAQVIVWALNEVANLSKPDGSFLRNPDEVVVLARGTTDHDGAFVFDHMPSWGVHPAHGFHWTDIDALSIGGVAAYVPGRTPAVVPTHLPEEGAVLNLVLACKLAGRVHGRVADLEGRPVANATVSRSPDAEENQQGWLPRGIFPAAASQDAVTDANGRYVLDGVPATGVSTLSASVLTWPERRACSVTLRVLSGADAEAPDLVLVPDWTKSAIVTVQTESGSPVWGAAIFDARYRTSPPLVRTGKDGKAGVGISNSDGGPYRIAVEAAGYARANAELEPRPDAPAEAVVTLVVAHAIAGRVVYPDGAPAAGARVFVGDGSRPIAEVFPDIEWWDYPTARVRADGGFEVGGLPPGPYHLAADVWAEDKRVASTFATVNESASLKLVLPRPEPDPTGSIVVTCTAKATGRPILKCIVRLHEVDDVALLGRPTAPGEFLLAAVRPGAWRLEIDPAGFVSEERTVEVVPGAVTRVAVAVEKGVTLKGRVKHPEGRRFRLATLSLTGCGQSAFLSPDGTFEVSGLAPGSKIGVTVEEQDGESSTTWVTRRKDLVTIPGDRAEITAEFPVVLAGTLTIVIRAEELFGGPMTDAKGRRIQGSRLEVEDGAGKRILDQKGIQDELTLNLPSGRYVIRLEVPGIPVQEKSLDLAVDPARVTFTIE